MWAGLPPRMARGGDSGAARRPTGAATAGHRRPQAGPRARRSWGAAPRERADRDQRPGREELAGVAGADEVGPGSLGGLPVGEELAGFGHGSLPGGRVLRLPYRQHHPGPRQPDGRPGPLSGVRPAGSYPRRHGRRRRPGPRSRPRRTLGRRWPSYSTSSAPGPSASTLSGAATSPSAGRGRAARESSNSSLTNCARRPGLREFWMVKAQLIAVSTLASSRRTS